MKKRLLSKILCLTMIFTMAAGSSQYAFAGEENEKTELTLLRLGDLTKAEPIFAPIIESFEKENPDIAVNFEAMAWGEADAKLKLLAAQNELPDVSFLSMVYGWDMANDGYLMNLKELFDADETLSQEIPQPIIDAATSADGEMYWIPSAVGAFSLWYNKDLFEQAGLDPNSPPETVEDMISYAQTITEKTGVPGLGWGISATLDFANIINSFYSSYTGADIWDDENNCFTFEGNEEYTALFVEALDEIAAITNDYGITQPNSIEYNPYGLRTVFRDGQCAMYLDGVWAVKEFAEELNKGEESKFNTGLFPAGPAGSHPIIGCDGWAIPESCENKEEAWKLLQYLMSSDNQTKHATEWGLLPVLKSEADKEEFSGAYWDALIKQEETVTARPKDKNVGMIEQAIADGGQAAATRTMSSEEAVQYMIDTVKENYME